jgi:hypothetical protein
VGSGIICWEASFEYPSDLLNQVNRCLEKCLPLLIGLGIKNPLSEACHALTK